MSAWPTAVPFDPENGAVPSQIVALFEGAEEELPVLLLVAGAGARRGGWAAGAAVAFASAAVDHGRRIVLADLSLEVPELHERLGGENAEGMADVFLFGASLRRVARTVTGRAFYFAPAGPYAPDPEEVLGHPRWDRLIGGFREAQATLLVYIPAELPGLPALAERCGTAVLLADPAEEAGIVAGLPDACTVAAVLRPRAGQTARAAAPESAPPPVPGEAVPEVPKVADPSQHAPAPDTAAPIVRPQRAPAPEPVAQAAARVASPFGEPVSEEQLLTEPAFVRRERRRTKRRVAPVLWLLLFGALAAGGWAATQRYGLSGVVPDQLPEWVPDRLPAWVSDRLPEWLALPSSAAEPVVPAPPGAAAVAARPIDTEVLFSVAIESHQDLEVAQERVAGLRDAEPAMEFFIAPIALEGVLYYRILAGPAADQDGATELMRRLYEAGHKTAMQSWDVRMTPWAYHLADFDSRAAAVTRGEALRAQGVPTYVVEIPYTSGPPRYRLYAGAYEGPAEAEVMAQILREAGLTAPLIRRTGRPAA